MHIYNTPGLYGLNDLMTQVSIFGKQICPGISGQGHQRNIGYLHVVELVSPMLYGKSHYHYMYLLL